MHIRSAIYGKKESEYYWKATEWWLNGHWSILWMVTERWLKSPFSLHGMKGFRLVIAEISPIRRTTLSNQSINQSDLAICNFFPVFQSLYYGSNLTNVSVLTSTCLGNQVVLINSLIAVLRRIGNVSALKRRRAVLQRCM